MGSVMRSGALCTAIVATARILRRRSAPPRPQQLTYATPAKKMARALDLRSPPPPRCPSDVGSPSVYREILSFRMIPADGRVTWWALSRQSRRGRPTSLFWVGHGTTAGAPREQNPESLPYAHSDDPTLYI